MLAFPLRFIAAALLVAVLSLFPGKAQAQGCTVPNQFVNGQIADANSVNANFTAVANCAGAALGHVSSLSNLRSYVVTNVPANSRIERDGYGTPGDGGAASYYFSTSACSLNAGSGDNGSQVAPLSGTGCWIAAFADSGIDWRVFGVNTASSDNHANYQNALDAAFRVGLPLLLNGPGTYKFTSGVYFYPTEVRWASNQVVLKWSRTATGALMRLVNAIGNTFPTAEMTGVTLIRPTIDMDASLESTWGGAGIVISDVSSCRIDDGFIYNGPTMGTPAPAGVTGAPVGTFKYTDGRGDGWVTNGALMMVGDVLANVEGCHITRGKYGHYKTPVVNDLSCVDSLGARGIGLTLPFPQSTNYSIPQNSPNPPNNNSFYDVFAGCNFLGIANDYSSGNTFHNTDTTASNSAGIVLGTYGRADFTLSGTGAPVAVTLMSDAIAGSPATAEFTGGGDAVTNATGLVAAINAKAAFSGQGITAGLYDGGTATKAAFWISWADEHSITTLDKPFNINFCASNTFPACSTSGALVIGGLRNPGWNLIEMTSSENSTAAVSVGANNTTWTYLSPQQSTGTSIIVNSNHGGQRGSTSPVIVVNRVSNAVSFGTPKNGNFTTNCQSDPQPYLISGGPITVTFGNTEPNGSECYFRQLDGTMLSGGPITFAPPSSVWGNYTIQGQSSLVSYTNWKELHFTLNIKNNSSASGNGNNSGGDWFGADGYPTPFTPADSSGASLSITDNGSSYFQTGNQFIANISITYPATANATAAQVSIPGTCLKGGAAPAFATGGGGAFYGRMTGHNIAFLKSDSTGALNSDLSGKTITSTFSCSLQ